MKFKTVYHFSVMDEIEEGKTVYFLDKETQWVGMLNDVPCEAAVKLIRKAKEDDDSVIFWKEIKENA